MHEMGIANSVLEAVQKETARYPASIPVKVGLKIGALTAIDADALRFCFDALTRDTELAGLQLEVEICPRRQRCDACSNEFVVDNDDFRCPNCDSLLSKCISGDELDLAYIEVEDHEPTAAGKESPQ